MINLKTKYLHLIRNKESLGHRLLAQYKRCFNFKGINTILDIGAGNYSFVNACRDRGYTAHGLDYPDFNAEEDYIPIESGTVDLVTMNAVIEHIKDPNNIMEEISKALRIGGYLVIRTPNFRMDYKNFYNDVTHIKPYTPESLKMLLELYDFHVVFLEPGLILKSKFWYKVPFKWLIAKYLTGGTRSVIIVGQKMGHM